jgi:glycogen synthase
VASSVNVFNVSYRTLPKLAVSNIAGIIVPSSGASIVLTVSYLPKLNSLNEHNSLVLAHIKKFELVSLAYYLSDAFIIPSRFPAIAIID